MIYHVSQVTYHLKNKNMLISSAKVREGNQICLNLK